LQDSSPRLDELVAQPPPEALEEAGTGKPRELSGRCPKGGRQIPLGSLGDTDLQGEIEIGGAIAYDGGYAVGFARRAGASRVAGVALFGPQATGGARAVQLGPMAEDAPAPLLASRSGQVLATAFGMPSGRPHGDPNRELRVYAVEGDHAGALTSFVKAADDSMASDIASDGRDAFVVWDEALSRPTGNTRLEAVHGVIRGAPVSRPEPKVAARDLSPEDSDAEDPRIVADGAGYSVLWIARSPGDVPASDASEVAGEPRAFGWLQQVAIDAQGAARAPVRDLTPRGGHLSAYDVRVFGNGVGLVVVARDDGEATDGSGGALLRVRARGGAVDPVESIEVGGVGRGAPAFVDGSPPWLSWLGHDEQLRPLPLDESGAQGGLASSEGALSEARPLAAWPSSTPAVARWLIATPSDPSGPFRVVDCALDRGL
jgi:hypothetical protein